MIRAITVLDDLADCKEDYENMLTELDVQYREGRIFLQTYEMYRKKYTKLLEDLEDDS